MFIGFREGLEAILVIVIILLYLKSTNNKIYYKYVFIGSILAIITSIIFAIVFTILFGGFEGFVEELFEGLTFIISGIFIITLILWISYEGPKMKEYLERRVEESINKEKLITISFLTYIIIIREGIELVLLLTGVTAIGSFNPNIVILGAIIGIGIALIIGLLIYFGIELINLSLFFKITNLILIFFAAGLITYGTHELIEAGIINPIIEEVWNIKHILPETFPDEDPNTPIWLEIFGSLLKALFGYNANPSIIEVIIYPIILITIGLISLRLWKKGKKNLKNPEFN
ncbi:MAG: hypothetical protein EU532_12020 [Promethearchaeota archaeon]|nr:MAG: hypothetical protein EU532_12020 [Candidatus Lokiarchaeota archaeon]